MSTSIKARVAALETTNAPHSDPLFVIIRPFSVDAHEDFQMSAMVGGAELMGEPGESEDAFVERVRKAYAEGGGGLTPLIVAKLRPR